MKDNEYFQFDPAVADDHLPLVDQLDYVNALAYSRLLKSNETARSLQIANDRAQLELDRSRGDLCYIATALDEFGGAVAGIMAVIRNLPTSLSLSLRLTTEQQAILQSEINDLLSELSDIDITLTSSVETDKRERALSGEQRAKAGTKTRKSRKAAKQ